MDYRRRSRFVPKLLAVLLVPFVVLAANGCDLAISFFANEDVAQQSIDGNPGGGLLPAQLFTTTLSVTSTTDYNNQNVDKLKKVTITELILNIDPESNQVANDPIEDSNPDDWSFMQSISISIRATIDGQQQTEVIASISSGSAQFNAGNTTLNFDTTGVDLLPYVLAPGGYEIIATATGNVPPDKVIFSGSAKYRVTANLFSQ